jgi:alginate O-acetyltransferase complex protein AlgJ
MERVADALALQINSLFPASVHSMERYRRLPVDLTSRGDIAAMLKTSHYQSWETVRITQIVTVDGQCWQADPMAEILVLGDSFCNIYSLPSLGWGSSAGLVEQLSFRLNRPVDRITRNDQGAAATRSALLAELKANPDRLRHTRCIVWQFVVRELAQGDWQLLSFPPPGRSDQNE